MHFVTVACAVFGLIASALAVCSPTDRINGLEALLNGTQAGDLDNVPFAANVTTIFYFKGTAVPVAKGAANTRQLFLQMYPIARGVDLEYDDDGETTATGTGKFEEGPEPGVVNRVIPGRLAASYDNAACRIVTVDGDLFPSEAESPPGRFARLA